eukprot:12409909-Prorocentrum_lima.AAC.1
MAHLEQMSKVTEYYGLVIQDHNWVLSLHARRNIDLYHSVLRLAYTSYIFMDASVQDSVEANSIFQ